MPNREKSFLWVLACLIGVPLLFFWMYKSDHRSNIQTSSNNSASSTVPIDKSASNSQPTNSLTVSPPSSGKDSNGCYTPDNVRKHYGETACVDYNVGYVYETRSGTKFLDQLSNYTAGFVGYIPYDSNANNMDINSLDGKNIKVSGYIQQYNSYPEIVINDPAQVSVY
jgi:hypothetical protein